MTTPRLEFSPDPLSDTTPTWTDITTDLMEIEWWNGKSNDLDEPQAGGMQCRLKNTNRRFEPDYVTGEFYPGIDTERRFRLLFDTDGPQGIEFWGDFEFGADGTAPEWTAMNGFVETLAGSEARQLSYVTSPTPRLGARIARFEVASGDKFGATTGERAEVRRGTPNGGFGTGTPDGQDVYYQFSFRPLGPWTHPSQWEIFHQQHSFDARFGQAMVRLQTTDDRGNFRLSLDTGEYPTLTDANNGTNAGTNYDVTGPAWAADVWWDVRYAIRWTSAKDGWLIWEMKQSTSSTWVRYANIVGIQTLPTVRGNATVGTVGDKIGFYRNDQAITNVVFHDGYQVGHSWSDVGYPTSTPGLEWNQITWDSAPNSSDNPDFEADIVGTASAGGGTTTRTWDTTRAKFGSGSLKAVTNGAASGQGVFHTQRSLTRFTATAGKTYTASAWLSGDGFEEIRIGIEWFDAGGASLSTTFALPKALRTDFRRHVLTAVAPANTATARVRTSYLTTTAGTFWVDGVGFWEGTYGTTYSEGLWYAESYDLEYPAKTTYSEVTVTCVDGIGLLANDALPTLDPPDATSYEDVIAYDQPSFYYRLGESEGTKLVSHVRKTKRHGHVHKRRFRSRETIAEVEGVAGPAGTYKNNPTLGVPGLIVGDLDTAVTMDNTPPGEYARIGPLDDSDSIDTNRLTVECWVDTADANQSYMGGPTRAAGAMGSVWLFASSSGPNITFFDLQFTDGTRAGASATWTSGVHHLVGTWNGTTIRLYIDGVLADADGSAAGKTLRKGDANGYIGIGAMDPDGTGLQPALNGTIDEVAIYEKALEPDTIMDHYQAGAQRGYNAELTGTRIASIASSPLWPTTAIEPGSFVLQPMMQFGQGKLDAIVEAVETERPRSLFFFNGMGAPVFRDFDSLDSSPTFATFGDSTEETPYVDLDLLYDNEVFNTVTGSIDGGRAITVTDAQSVADRKPKTRDDEVSMPLTDEDDVRTVISTVLSEWKTPTFRPTTVTFLGVDADRVSKILHGTIGETVRVKRRGEGGVAIDRQCVVLGYRKSYTARERILSCTFQLSRGFNAGLVGWRLGTTGFDELGTNTVLA